MCDNCRGAVVCQFTGKYYLIVLPGKLLRKYEICVTKIQIAADSKCVAPS